MCFEGKTVPDPADLMREVGKHLVFLQEPGPPGAWKEDASVCVRKYWAPVFINWGKTCDLGDYN
jgi:hypothetical protein